MTHPPSTINLPEVTTRAEHAHNVISGFSLAFPTLAGYWRQIDGVLADVPALAAEISRLRAQLADIRLDRANLAAAALAALAAWRNGDTDHLAYLRDELGAQGFYPAGGRDE